MPSLVGTFNQFFKAFAGRPELPDLDIQLMPPGHKDLIACAEAAEAAS